MAMVGMPAWRFSRVWESSAGGDNYEPGVFETFDSLDAWALAASGELARISEVPRGVLRPVALNFNAEQGAGSTANITRNPELDLGGRKGFWLLANSRWRQGAISKGVTLYLGHSEGLPGGSDRWNAGSNVVHPAALGQQAIWQSVGAWSVLSGAPSLDRPILSWRYMIGSSASGRNDIDLLGAFWNGRRAKVMITQDDGHATTYSFAFPECRSRGIPQTHYLIANLLGGAGYITPAQAKEMRAAGDALGLHGGLRWDQDPSRIASDKAALDALGLDTAHAAYPEGAIGDGAAWTATTAAMDAAGVKTARITGGTAALPFPILRRYAYKHALPAHPLNSSMSLAQAKGVIDRAIESGGSVIFYGHQYGAAADSLTWTTSDFVGLLDYIAEKRGAGLIDAETIDSWWSDKG